MFVIFFLLSISISVRAVRITSYSFLGCNETYTFLIPMNFHTITIDDSYIVFNTRFYISQVMLLLSHLRMWIQISRMQVMTISFYSFPLLHWGSVSFVIYLFVVGNTYDVKRGGTLIDSATADETGLYLPAIAYGVRIVWKSIRMALRQWMQHPQIYLGWFYTFLCFDTNIGGRISLAQLLITRCWRCFYV